MYSYTILYWFYTFIHIIIVYNHIIIHLPYTFPYIFKSWLIPNCTRIIAWGVVHNCTLNSSMECQLIHNDRVVGKVFQSWRRQCPLLSVPPTKRRLTVIHLYFLHSCLHFHPCLCWSVIAPLVAMALITICVKHLNYMINRQSHTFSCN